MTATYKIQVMLGGEWGDWFQGPFTLDEANAEIFRQVDRLLAQPGERETLSDLNRWRAVRV